MNLRIRNRVKRAKEEKQNNQGGVVKKSAGTAATSKKEGLTDNGRLMRGYRYKGGEVVRASTWSKYYSE